MAVFTAATATVTAATAATAALRAPAPAPAPAPASAASRSGGSLPDFDVAVFLFLAAVTNAMAALIIFFGAWMDFFSVTPAAPAPTTAPAPTAQRPDEPTPSVPAEIYESQVESKCQCGSLLCLRELESESDFDYDADLDSDLESESESGLESESESESYWGRFPEPDFEPVPKAKAKAKTDFEMDPENKDLLALRTSCIEELRRVLVAKLESKPKSNDELEAEVDQV